MIKLPPLAQHDTELWKVLIELRAAHDGWTLIGGQMVFLLGLEHAEIPPRVSADIDLVADIRAQPPRLANLVAWLTSHGFSLGEPDPDGYAHRFTRDRLGVDVLAPDGAGERAARDTSSSTRTPAISGGTYALSRSRDLDVTVEQNNGRIPCPDLAGALVVKSRAALVDRRLGPDRHLRDLGFLYSLVSDPIAVRDTLGPRNQARLRAVEALRDETHIAWVTLGRSRSENALAAYTIVTQSD